MVVADEHYFGTNSRARLQDLTLPIKGWPDLAAGSEARVEAATASEVDFVMSAIVGVAGLEATYAAVKAKKRIGLANKEVLVASGALVMEAVRRLRDRAHSSGQRTQRRAPMFSRRNKEEVTRLLLTASGGPFQGYPARSSMERHSRASAESPYLENGASHHD